VAAELRRGRNRGRHASVTARRRGDEFRAVVVSVAGKASKAFALVLKSSVLPMTLMAMGEYQDPDGSYMPSILY